MPRLIQANRDVMTENEYKKFYGAVYTPTPLAEYVAKKIVKYYSEANDGAFDIESLKVIDPACGDGELLAAIWKQMVSTVNDSTRGKVTRLPNPSNNLFGIDIDKAATDNAVKRLSTLDASLRRKMDSNILHLNSLMPCETESPTRSWRKIMNRCKVVGGFDLMIANPPWGASLKEIDSYITKHYAMSKGQSDSADLFVELGLTLLKPGGFCGIILPDSIFAFERSRLREMLLSQTEIKYIGRLGEKIFKDVNRACVVLIFRKKMRGHRFSENLIECLRLTPELREQILRCKMTFETAEHSLIHSVKQKRFEENSDYVFDLDLREDEEEVVSKIKSQQGFVGDYLTSTRGVELSKSGKVLQCNACGLWIPYPTAKQPTCQHCHAIIEQSQLEAKVIVSKAKLKGFSPLIVGESISRYSINQVRWIDKSKKGINYKKDSIYEGEKIVIRKTGVGISASIDYNNALTNQVVYIFKLRPEAVKVTTLEFLLAIINSRAMYYYIAKNHGETEWRSHPYITQKQILGLPMPEINPNCKQHKKIINTITKMVKRYLTENRVIPDKVDAKIETLIATLYGLNKVDYETIFDTIHHVEELLPVRALKAINIDDIFGSRG